MNHLLRLERRIESLVEGFFSRWGRDRIHPVEIGRRLLREMDQGAVAGLSGTVVPNEYQVFLHPRDFTPYASLTAPLVRELEDALRARAQELGATLPGPLRVTLDGRDEITIGQVYVEARLVPGPGGGPAQPGSETKESPAVSADTRVYRRRSGTARLRIQAGPPGAAGAEFALDHPVMTIGRRPDQDIVLNDPTVSGAHARVERTAEGVSIADLESTNGTLVNGHPVRSGQVALHPGDRIQIGTILLELLTEP